MFIKGTGAKSNDEESNPSVENAEQVSKTSSPVSEDTSSHSSDQNPNESEVRQRNVNQMHSNTTNANINTNTNGNLDSSSSGSRFTTYLIGILCLAIGFLLFRRLFLL